MTDTMTREQRHRCMSHIRAKDTKPEMVVRRFLWSHGFRYRLHSKKLPGHPDIVLGKYKTVVFVNGCFWHGHNAGRLPEGELANSECCKIPHSNRRFWLDKINRNMARDGSNVEKLTAEGWHVITIWECDLKPKRRQSTLDNLLSQLNRIIRPQTDYLPLEEDYGMAAEPDANYRGIGETKGPLVGG